MNSRYIFPIYYKRYINYLKNNLNTQICRFQLFLPLLLSLLKTSSQTTNLKTRFCAVPQKSRMDQIWREYKNALQELHASMMITSHKMNYVRQLVRDAVSGKLMFQRRPMHHYPMAKNQFQKHIPSKAALDKNSATQDQQKKLKLNIDTQMVMLMRYTDSGAQVPQSTQQQESLLPSALFLNSEFEQIKY